MIEVVVAGLGPPQGTTAVLLLLKERAGLRVLSVGIGRYEAEAIALHFRRVPVPRPLTHDLLVEVLDRLQGTLRRVELSALEHGAFYARLMVEQAGQETAIDSRASDAVALAVRVGVPIFVAETVMDQAGVVPEQPKESEEREAVVDVSKLSIFAEFINTLAEDDDNPGRPESPS